MKCEFCKQHDAQEQNVLCDGCQDFLYSRETLEAMWQDVYQGDEENESAS